jgi:hypothetical protein
MARRLKNGEGEAEDGKAGTTEGHNSEARAEIIRAACRDITALVSERNSISSEIREIKQSRIKGDLNMKLSDFNTALRLYQLEGDDRDELFHTLRECFQALGVGEQLDFLGALKEQRAREAEAGLAPT